MSDTTAPELHQLLRNTIAHLLDQSNGLNANPSGGLDPKIKLVNAAAALLNTTAGANAASGSYPKKD